MQMDEQSNWQQRLFEAIEAEREENERLKKEDPAAFEAKRLASLPWTRSAMCRVDFKGYGNNAFPIIDGEVCDECNVQVVKQRIRSHQRSTG